MQEEARIKERQQSITVPVIEERLEIGKRDVVTDHPTATQDRT